MAVAESVSIEEYLKTEYTTPTEYLNGRLLEKSMPTWTHGAIQAWITILIIKNFPKFFAGGEVHNHLSATEYRLPDVSVQLRTEMDMKGYADTPIYLAVEILSPNDSIGQTFAKCERFHVWGTPYCWLIDPERLTAWTYHKGEVPVPISTNLTAGEIELTIAEIFSIL